jgi:hypothetical protein
MATMTIGLVQTAWLFTRGSQSVRIVRITRPDGAQQLLVSGPGAESSVHDAEDPIFCVRYQADLERRLVSEGYQLASFISAERRPSVDRRGTIRGTDRRRPFHHLM